ncbi:condensation domain-containing protein, partial [Pseudomonas sp. VEM90]
MAQMDNTSLVQRFIKLPLAQRRAFLEKLAGKGMSLANLPLPPCREGFETLPLSYAQQRQWFLWHLAPDSSAYHVPSALRLVGEVDTLALRRALEHLAARHEALRTTFDEDQGQACQRIHGAGELGLDFQVEVLASQPDAAALQVLVASETERLFDLRQGPLWRVRLLTLAPTEHVLVLTLHHIVSDGASMQVLVDELVRLYQGERAGQPAALAPLPVQYADYAIWQRQWMEAGERERQLAYWAAHLGDAPYLLELPSDRPRPPEQSYRGARLDLVLPQDLGAGLQQLARQQGVTLFMLLLASFQTLLHRYSGQAQVRSGVPVANRNRPETRGLIGFFVNTQVMKAEFSDTLRFEQLLAQVKADALAAQAHQELAFEHLVEALQPERDLSHHPLFQTMFNHQAQGRAVALQVDGLAIEPLTWQGSSVQFDLMLDTFETGEGLAASFKYATDLFDASTIERLAGHWQRLLEAIVSDPAQCIGDLAMLDDEQRRQLVEGFNATATEYPLDTPVQRLIEAQVQRTPDAEALVFGDLRLSYAELDARANQLANR